MRAKQALRAIVKRIIIVLLVNFTYKSLHCVTRFLRSFTILLFLETTHTKHTHICVCVILYRKKIIIEIIMVTGNSERDHIMPSVLSNTKWHSDQQISENKKVSIMRRRTRLDRCIIRKPRIHSIERKVRMLKKLVPNCESMGSVERLFKETTEYILALQTRVKLMQIAADVLSGSAESDHQ
ncbi:uncharacterized protein [Primulina eburnea]|uniref:uncharacterized protein n=1 Tax=Primulina eburnea TaxID=1245227 RepID=UPI003C6CB44E